MVDDGGATQFYKSRLSAEAAGIPGSNDPWQRLLGLLRAGCWNFRIDCSPAGADGIGLILWRTPSCHGEYSFYQFVPRGSSLAHELGKLIEYTMEQQWEKHRDMVRPIMATH